MMIDVLKKLELDNCSTLFKNFLYCIFIYIRATVLQYNMINIRVLDKPLWDTTRTHTLTHAQTHTETHTYKDTHTQKHHTHKLTHAHTHTKMPLLSSVGIEMTTLSGTCSYIIERNSIELVSPAQTVFSLMVLTTIY